jgi:hypothetical protein
LFRNLLFSSSEFRKGGGRNWLFQPQASISLHLKKSDRVPRDKGSLTVNHNNHILLSLRPPVLDASHTVSTTIPPPESQTVMAAFGAFGDPFGAPPEPTPQQDPFATQFTVPRPAEEPEDEEEWEYEYSTTELEVC